jgi:excisionase family DNA binding protein
MRSNMEKALQEKRLARSIPEIAEATGLSIPFLRLKAKKGELRVRHIGRRVLVLEEDLRAFLEGTDGKASGEQAA